MSSNTTSVSAASSSAPAFPPGLGPLPARDRLPPPPGIVRDSSTNIGSTSSAEAVLPVAATQYDYVRDLRSGFVNISLSPSQEATLYGLAVDTSPDPSSYVAEWEKMPAPDTDSPWGSEYTAKTEDVVESLWGEDDGVEKKKKADAILCTVHGIICKKGICKEYARLLREKERAVREAAAPKGRANGGGGGQGKANNGNGGRKTHNNNGWKKKGGGNNKGSWNDDDSSSATGSSEGRRSAAGKTTNDGGWATVRGR
ncbi:hypothetical protein B0H10DRAFT_507913 [Mycena sp. CBHHK59/15]|nr:hypothetical protein B0H10DRAFT_507913 [Mycena sp. CBHHK59/15]